ncbi:Rnf-Nqr domain containing protein [Candidatus Similichlamydia epinepheli]|uniref:Rnf-Nqr domain containing protein n=1 Tax=Candidatus Similichlamydia epinepheli TaxID=1903953 RepID=UPI001300562C|nr:Rnf-Nqr domain containing protein [Candidatus Similichlamydia epinepheli]
MQDTTSSHSLILLFFRAALLNNYILAKFLGVCTCLACSDSLKKANAVGFSVFLIMTVSNSLNWVIYNNFIRKGALSWIPIEEAKTMDMSYINFLVLISLTCGSVQVLVILLEAIAPRLSSSIGVYMRLLAVNCAILAACTNSLEENHTISEHLSYQMGAGCGWWLAVLLLAGLRQRARISSPIPQAKGTPILFVMMGLTSMSFAAFSGLDLSS